MELAPVQSLLELSLGWAIFTVLLLSGQFRQPLFKNRIGTIF